MDLFIITVFGILGELCSVKNVLLCCIIPITNGKAYYGELLGDVACVVALTIPTKLSIAFI